jgi:hypothetical protein
MLLRYQPIESALSRPPWREAPFRLVVLLLVGPEAAALLASMASKPAALGLAVE